MATIFDFLDKYRYSICAIIFGFGLMLVFVGLLDFTPFLKEKQKEDKLPR